MERNFDCLVCGSCVADLLVRPIPLEVAIGSGKLRSAEPVRLTTGGIVCNAGIAMARLGMRIAAFTYVGRDEWGELIRRRLEAEGVDCGELMQHPTASTGTTAVLIDPSGERSFAHCIGATTRLDRPVLLAHLDLFARSRMMLIGYYSLMPDLEDDLALVLEAVRKTGCRTALDAAGGGGALQPLDRMLPHLDVYVPSLAEAAHQTGQSEPRAIIRTYRACGAPGLLGVKLGSRGALLSPAADQFIEIPQVAPPGPVIDTTGAGDCFYAGLLTGLLGGMSPRDAGLLAAAAGACCVTALGGAAGVRDLTETARLAGVTITAKPA